MPGEITAFCTAISYYTRIPLYDYSDFSPETFKKANKYFPLTGWIVGGVAASVFLLAELLFPKSIAVFFSMLSTILLTGAFHEDGLADSVDGFGGGYTREKILSIMKDSRIGTFGAIALLAVLAIKFLILYELPTLMLPVVLVAGHSISRFTAISFLATHEYSRYDDDTSRAANVVQKISPAEIITAGLFGILPLLWLGYKYFLVLIPLFITRQIIGDGLNRNIQGYTGDTLGAAQQISEVVFYIAIFLLIKWTFI